jgi:phage antirepressor YoqD-like protein
MKFINEGNLFRLITRSKLPEAETFESYVFDEILPTIRKTGSYNTKHQLPQTMIEAVESYLIEMKKNVLLEAEKQQLAIENTAQKQQLKEQETPIAIYNLAIAAQNTQSMADVAKALGTGRTRLFGILREEGIIPDSRTVPYQRYIESGYFVVRERPRTSGDTVINDPVPRVTAKGFDYIARILQKRSNPGA